MVLKYVNEKNEIPIRSVIYIVKDDNSTEYKIQLGIFYNNLKQGCNKDILNDLICKNEVIKKDIERYNKEKEERKNKKEFTAKEKGQMLLKYVNEKNEIPIFKYIYIVKDDNSTEHKIQLGQFYDSLKQGKNKDILNDLICKSEVIKKDIERYNKEKKERKIL